MTERVVEKLHGAGIHTTEQLLTLGATPSGRFRLADETHLDIDEVAELVHIADLMRINGVGPEYATLLYQVGAASTPKLAYRSPHLLAEAIEAYTKEHDSLGRIPTLSECEHWVAEAKKLPKVIQH